MKVQIEAVHFHANDKLRQLVEGQVSKLEQFSDKLIHANVFLHVISEQPHEVKVETELYLPGPTIYASDTGDQFEPVVNKVVAQLKRQIIKRKEKQASHR